MKNSTVDFDAENMEKIQKDHVNLYTKKHIYEYETQIQQDTVTMTRHLFKIYNINIARVLLLKYTFLLNKRHFDTRRKFKVNIFIHLYA